MGGFSGTQFQIRTREYPKIIAHKEAIRSPMENMSVIPRKVVPVDWVRKIAGCLPHHKPEYRGD